MIVDILDEMTAEITKLIVQLDPKKLVMPSSRNDGMEMQKCKILMTLSSCSSKMLQLRKILPPSFGIGEWKERVSCSVGATLVP